MRVCKCFYKALSEVGLLLAGRRFTVLAFALLVLFWGSAFGAIKISLE